MKKILIFLFLVISVATQAQITLDKKYDFSASVVNLETEGYKYYLMDVPNEQCRIYNMDHSIYKTISCNVPNGYYLSDIKLVSQNLFDTDSGIEILFTYYKYVATTDSYYYIYGTRIANENGNVILTIDGSRYNYVNKTGEDTYQLFSYCFDYSVFPEIVWTNIYNLPGQINSSAAMVSDSQDILLKSFPNPATKSVKIEYELPENVDSGKLFFYNSNGQPLSSFLIDGHSNFLNLSVSQLPKGMYFYNVEYNGQRTESKKVVVR